MRRRLSWLWLVGGCLAANAAQPVAPLAASTTSYLFLVDTSLSMRHEAVTARNLVYDLLRSGLDDAMLPGDVFAIWTFNDQVYPDRFRAQTWLPELNQTFANRAYNFLRLERCERRRRMDRVVTAMTLVLHNTDPLVVVLISDGDEAILGTPFDRELNVFYQRHALEWSKARKPFITTLVGRRGKWIAWAVNGAGDKITIPVTTETVADATVPPVTPAQASPGVTPAVHSDQARPQTTEPTPPPTEATSQRAAVKPAPAPNPVPSAPAPTPVQQSPTPVPPAPAAPTPAATETVPPPKTPAPPAEVKPAVKPVAQPPPMQVEKPKPAPTPAPASAQPATTTQAAAEKPPAAPPPVVSLRPTDQPRVATEPPGAKPKPPDAQPALRMPPARTNLWTATNPGAPKPGPAQTGVVVPPPSTKGRALLFVGIGLVLLALGLIAFMSRRARSRPSATFITRSIDSREK